MSHGRTLQGCDDAGPGDTRIPLRAVDRIHDAQMKAYLRAVHKYPLDAAAATKAWDAMQCLSGQVFQLRLEAMSRARQIMGKKLWAQLREGGGIYFGAPPRR
jgi:hypothetical protein